jgi:serine/tyrosine/threonine adenylyltransferase
MPSTAAFQPRAAFAALGPDFADPVEPADFPQAILRWRHQRAAEEVGLGALSEAEWIDHFARFAPLPGAQSACLAMRYHGHQFQTYNPQIGDGRGFLFAQMLDARGRLLDLGTKGSGQTPYSRFGDGRLTLKGGVREVLATAMLESLGVPTSRSFSLIETGERLARNDEPSPTRSSVLVRLQHSHIRFGTFQRHAFHNAPENLRALVDHCAAHYYPDLLELEGEARVVGLMEAAARAQARTVAAWMAAGFVHGVLNTDNMNITGESFDYGPYRFLPVADANFTAAYFDHAGLYAYGRQPQAVFWNLKQLAGALSLICPAEALVPAVNVYAHAFAEDQRALLHARLGIEETGEPEEDAGFLNDLYAFLSATGARWEQVFHDWFCGAASESRAARSPIARLYAHETFALVRKGFEARPPVRPERLAAPYFAREAPASLHIDVIEALWTRIAEADDWAGYADALALIEEQRRALDFGQPTQT